MKMTSINSIAICKTVIYRHINAINYKSISIQNFIVAEAIIYLGRLYLKAN